MLSIQIRPGRVRIDDGNGLDLSLPVPTNSADLHLQEGVLVGYQLVDLESQTVCISPEEIGQDSYEEAVDVDIEKILAEKLSREPKKKVSDYIADVFRVARRPLKALEIAGLISELTEYDINRTQSPGSSMRSAMKREQVGKSEENRFLKLNSSYWLLAELEDELRRAGKLTEFERDDVDQTEIGIAAD